MENAESRSRDAPYPVSLAGVFDTCLVAAKLLLSWNCFGQLVISTRERLGNRARAELGEITTRNRNLQNVFHPRFDG